MNRTRTGSAGAAILTLALAFAVLSGLAAVWATSPATASSDARTEGASGRALAGALLAELEAELDTTRRVLERVPEDRLTWKPHESSRTLGSLARHVAELPGLVAGFLAEDTLDFDAVDRSEPEPESRQAILDRLEESQLAIRSYLSGADDAELMSMWTLTRGADPVLTLPRAGVVRGFLISHHIHHRGQLTVYLRMLEVPVPSVYGPSADEMPPFLAGG